MNISKHNIALNNQVDMMFISNKLRIIVLLILTISGVVLTPLSRYTLQPARSVALEASPRKEELLEEQTTTDNLVLSRLVNIHSVTNRQELSFKFFISNFVCDALSRNLLSFPITKLEEITDPKTKQIPDILAPDSLEKKEVIQIKGINVKSFPSLKEDELGIKRIIDKVDGNALIWLPYPYIIAGNFHKEMYPHDTSAVLWALLEQIKEGKAKSPKESLELVKNQLENFYSQVKNFGFPLNGNRGYYLERSQTNIIPTNVLQYFNLTNDKVFLREIGLPLAESIFTYWTNKQAEIHTPYETGYRWISHGNGPCQEIMESHDAHNYYYFKVLQTLVKFLNLPDIDRPIYAKGFDYKRVIEEIDVEKIKEYKKVNKLIKQNIDDKTGLTEAFLLTPNVYEPIIKVKEKYYKLTNEYYRNDRASRVSGYDTNHLYGPFNAFTYDFIPVDHNVLLYKHAKDIAKMHKILGNNLKSQEFLNKANQLKELVIKLLWDENLGMFFDYNSKTKKLRTEYPFLSAAYVLWAEMLDIKNQADKRKLIRLVDFLEENFEGSTGLYASTTETGLHWDKPYVWPVQQQYIVYGLRQYSKQLREDKNNNLANHLEEIADRISIKYLIANYSDWLNSNGTKIGEKVIPKEETLLTGYSNGSNYTWNLACVSYLYNTLSNEAKKAFDSLID